MAGESERVAEELELTAETRDAVHAVGLIAKITRHTFNNVVRKVMTGADSHWAGLTNSLKRVSQCVFDWNGHGGTHAKTALVSHKGDGPDHVVLPRRRAI
jgi:hypothetical protein